MKITLLAAGILAIAGLSPATAQGIGPDVRCLILSNVFSKAAKEEKAREAAGQAMIFFAGRLDGRVAAAALAAEMRNQSKTINEKSAGNEMVGCANRVAKAQASIQSAASTIKPAK